MEYVCPICNGLVSYVLKCDNCGGQMENKGAIVDFLDDYSPYLSMDITQRVNFSQEKCIHLFSCNNCNHDKRTSINKMYF